MKPVMKVFVRQVNSKFYEGVVQLPNLVLTRLQKENGGTHYASISHLKQAAQAAAKKYNAVLDFVESKMIAAKQSTKK